jgi:hypothetical protein
MKRLFSALAGLAVAAALLVMLSESKQDRLVVHAHNGCSNATLVGNYGFAFSGFQQQHNKSLPFYGAGIANFDGAGNLSATFAYSLDGTSSTGNPYTASYTVNSDCSVSLTATPGSGGDNLVGAIVGDGAEVLTTDISSPDTLNLEFKRQ